MTVIAWDGRTVAADSLCRFGCYRGPMPVEKIVKRNGVVFGITDYSSWFDAWIGWYFNGQDPKEVPECKLTSGTGNFLVFKDGRAYACTYDLPYLQEVGAPDAWGSGCEFAIGAMKAGKNAKEAVEIVIECNPDSGGPVQVIDLLQLQECEAT